MGVVNELDRLYIERLLGYKDIGLIHRSFKHSYEINKKKPRNISETASSIFYGKKTKIPTVTLNSSVYSTLYASGMASSIVTLNFIFFMNRDCRKTTLRNISIF